MRERVRRGHRLSLVLLVDKGFNAYSAIKGWCSTLRKCDLAQTSLVIAPLIFLLLADLSIGDYGLFTIINQKLSNPILDLTCAYLAPALFAVFYLITLTLLYSSKDKEDASYGVVSLVNGPLSYGVGSMIKILIARPRPLEVLDGVRIIGIWHTSTYSFPSTTTMLVFGFTLPILFKGSRYGFVLTALSYLIGFSVVYTGYHFPSDVVAGVLLSIPITAFTTTVKGRIKKFLDAS